MKAAPVVIEYTNHRGDRGKRVIKPILIEFTSSLWHPEPQWVLVAFDVEKSARRGFALKDIHSWEPAPE